jgi:class 3 adenylate cyclase
VLFSDVVGSTERASALGDARWKRLIERHDKAARSCVGRRGGTIIKKTGDGVLATFPSTTSAVRAAGELRSAMLDNGLEVRIGIHAGDVDRRDDDLSGIALHIANRIAALAQPSEILVSRTVVDLTAGSGLQFVARGERELKGVPGSWPIFGVLPSD